ncbi:Histone H4 transcription factor [Trichinella pseudospiralis]|uniref:Histone H4 transcription factor n=1 Tax=Trichinella pseudospiralis TaxID=6337 RepID=A0A0V1E909_TRIPS|nr:Histone H4 transcription factor [Trichinella pseudospiralis]
MAILSQCIWVALSGKKKNKLWYNCCAFRCAFKTRKKYKMFSHINKHRSVRKEGSIQCPFSKCNFQFLNDEDYDNHLSYHRVELNLQEKGMSFLMNRKEHADGQLRCPQVMNKISNGCCETLLYNMKHVCRWNNCNMDIPKLDRFYAHVVDHVQSCKQGKRGTQKKCEWENCGKMFKQCSILLEHISTHTGSKLMSCPYCMQTFSNRNGLLHHMMRQARREECAYECDKCRKKFKSEYLLKAHKKCHVYKVFCHLCGRPAVTNSNLKQHMLRMHKPDSDFPCSKCDKRFKTRDALEAHQVSSHEDQDVSHRCPNCGDRFLTLSHFVAHRKTAHNIKQYRCHLCMHNFPLRNMLSKHLKTQHHIYPPSYTSRFRYLPKGDGVYELADIQRQHIQRKNLENCSSMNDTLPALPIDPILMELPNSSDDDGDDELWLLQDNDEVVVKNLLMMFKKNMEQISKTFISEAGYFCIYCLDELGIICCFKLPQ